MVKVLIEVDEYYLDRDMDDLVSAIDGAEDALLDLKYTLEPSLLKRFAALVTAAKDIKPYLERLMEAGEYEEVKDLTNNKDE